MNSKEPVVAKRNTSDPNFQPWRCHKPRDPIRSLLQRNYGCSVDPLCTVSFCGNPKSQAAYQHPMYLPRRVIYGDYSSRLLGNAIRLAYSVRSLYRKKELPSTRWDTVRQIIRVLFYYGWYWALKIAVFTVWTWVLVAGQFIILDSFDLNSTHTRAPCAPVLRSLSMPEGIPKDISQRQMESSVRINAKW